MQLTTSQKKCVDKLLKAFANKENYKFASFKAPTGSGKTFMASEFIARVFANEIAKVKKTIFVVATVSNAELPKQLAKKLENYKKYHEFNNYTIEYIQSPSVAASKKSKSEDIVEFVLEDNKVFVFGTSSFGKNRLFNQNKTLITFLEQAKQLNYQIFFIRDEAHIGKKEQITKNDLKTFDQKINKAADFIINMTATPKDRRNLIEMIDIDKPEDEFYLLKTNMKKTKLHDEVSNSEIIDDAIKTFKKTKKEYQTLDPIINPAMLIQIMNESEYEQDRIKNEQFHEGLNLLEKKLKKNGLKYLKYLNSNPTVVGTNVPNTLEYASKIDSEIDAIIFKVGPATGWDIPRANMLLQLRNVSSETLNLQTLGRIMRNPYPNLAKHPITDKYYVWSNYQKPTRSEAVYRIKEKFNHETFVAGRINKNSKMFVKEQANYVNAVLKFLDSNEFLNYLNDLDILKDIIYDKMNYGHSVVVKNPIPNHLYLKIFNLKKRREFEKLLQISKFASKIIDIAKQLVKNEEIVWYVFFHFIEQIKKIKNANLKWIHESEPYCLINDAKPSKHFIIWKDNTKEPKSVDTGDFEHYGYSQVTGDKNIQFLDSTPEYQFYDRFTTVISDTQKLNISFFAKMPSLGSQVYFEYFSKSKGAITKSFMDFAIKYKDKTILIEVKSQDEDYNQQKTKELLDVYQIYMEKFHDKKLSLVLFQYKKSSGTNFLSGYINNNWEKNIGFRRLFDSLLD